MSSTNPIHAVLKYIRTIRSDSIKEHQRALDNRFYTYCWNYNHADFGDYTVVEVEDLTVPIQLDDASLFNNSIEFETADSNTSQLVY